MLSDEVLQSILIFKGGRPRNNLSVFPYSTSPTLFLLSMLLAEGSWSNSWQLDSLLGQNEMRI